MAALASRVAQYRKDDFQKSCWREVAGLDGIREDLASILVEIRGYQIVTRRYRLTKHGPRRVATLVLAHHDGAAR